MLSKWIRTAAVGAAGMTAALAIVAARAAGKAPVLPAAETARETVRSAEERNKAVPAVEVMLWAVEEKERPAAAVKSDPIDLSAWREWTDADAEILAKLLWSSPLRNEDEKRRLVWVVLNRVDDEGPLFDRTIAGNVNRQEFTFFDRKAHVSETNMRIAREELDRWTRVLVGIEARPVPAAYVYIRFSGERNGVLEISQSIGGEAWSA